MIPMNNCPPGKYKLMYYLLYFLVSFLKEFKDRPNDYEKSLFVAKIIDIPADKKFARGYF